MCGISGIIDFKKKNNLNDVSNYLLSQLNHRGPDYNNSFIDKDIGLTLCHNRLSIIDTSLKASQPMRSYCGRYIIIFNGEIYNYLVLKNKLNDFNINFKSSSDTEVLLNSISKFGLKNTLDNINGMFAFALWDTKNNEIILCRDRFGQKPLYYAYINQVFIFSSELKSIKNFFKKNLLMNQEAFYYFNKYGYINDPMTIYKDVYKLKASNYLKISTDNLMANYIPDSICYWNFRKKAYELSLNRYSDFNEAKDKIFQEINNSVSECMVADVPIGSFLSGGLDSSIVSYFMQKNSNKKINTFSMGNENIDYDESKDSRATAKYLNTFHTEFFLKDTDIINIVEKIPYIYDEPFADSSQIPTIYLSEKTSSEVKVVLTGDGGDEMFGGYNRHIYSNKFNNYIKYLPISLRLVIKNIFGILPLGLKKILLNIISNETNIKLLEIKLQKIISIIQSKDKKILYDKLCSQLDDNLNLFKNENYEYKNINYFRDWPYFDSYLNQMLILDTEFYLNGDILVKLDRGSMHSSLEARSPLLSNYLFDEVWRLSENFKIKNNKGKLILQSIAEDIFPKNFLSRPKIGFGVPIGDYLKTNLNIWANDLINSSILKHDMFLNDIYVKRIWNEHCSNIKDWSFTLWNLLNYLQWKNKIQND